MPSRAGAAAAAAGATPMSLLLLSLVSSSGGSAHAAAAVAVAAAPFNPNFTVHGCMAPNTTDLPFCDTSLSFAARAADLVGRLMLEEKLCFTNANDHCGAPRLGLPAYNWGVEDLHGAGIACIAGAVDGSTRCPTIFPDLAVLAAGFNETAWEGVGTVIGTEMRASNNVGGTRMREVGINSPIGLNAWGALRACVHQQHAISFIFAPHGMRARRRACVWPWPPAQGPMGKLMMLTLPAFVLTLCVCVAPFTRTHVRPRPRP